MYDLDSFSDLLGLSCVSGQLGLGSSRGMYDLGRFSDLFGLSCVSGQLCLSFSYSPFKRLASTALAFS